MMLAAGPGAVELKKAAPVPPGEVIRNPFAAKPTDELIVAKPVAVAE